MEGPNTAVEQVVYQGYITLNFPLSSVVAKRWKLIGQEKGIADDSTVAAFLVRRYEETQGSQMQASFCETCCSPLGQFCPTCFTLTPKQQQQASKVWAMAHGDGDSDLQNETDHKIEEPGDCDIVNQDSAAVDFKVEVKPETLPSFVRDSTSYEENENTSDDETEIEDASDAENSSGPLDFGEEEVSIKYEDDFSRPGVTKNSSVKNTIDDTETFMCNFCMQVLPDPDGLTIHMQEHRDQMLHECSECKARFFESEILKKHMKCHTRKRKYPCDQCNKVMSRLDNLKRHKFLKHRNNPDDSSLPDSISHGVEEGVFPEAKYKCDNCGKGFRRKDNFDRHMRSHLGEKLYGCQQCGAAFKDLKRLIPHMYLHNSHLPFQCGKCRKCFIDQASMTRHVCKPNEPKLQCKSCRKTFATSSQLILHSRVHLAKSRKPQPAANMDHKPSDERSEQLKDQIAECVNGDNNFKTETKRRRGRPPKSKSKKTLIQRDFVPPRPSTPDQQASTSEHAAQTDIVDGLSHPHVCEFCGARFMFHSHLTHHLQEHTGENVFKCSQCPVVCRSLASLEIHNRIHRTAKEFTCEYCGKILKSAYAHKIHLCSHTGEKPFKCEECGECFSSKSKFNDHADVHSGGRLHLCPYCGKSFLRSSNLSGHIRIHTHIRKHYTCQYCGKILRSRNTLKEHVRSHTGEKPFKCEICGMCFMRSGTYKTHVRKHSGIKPHECSFCGKCFLHPCHLRVHVRIHTGEKPYKCPECPKTFAIISSLKEHMRKHTGDKPFKCSVCGKAFAKSCNRLAHFRTHSKNQRNALVAQNDTKVD